MFYKIIHHTVAIYPESNLLIPTDSRMRNSNLYSYKHIGTSKDFYKYIPGLLVSGTCYHLSPIKQPQLTLSKLVSVCLSCYLPSVTK